MSPTPAAPEPRPASAPAPHTVTTRHADDGTGLMVGHLLCDAPEVYVPAMPPDEGGSYYVLAIDIIQAVIGHECPGGTEGQTVGSLL